MLKLGETAVEDIVRKLKLYMPAAVALVNADRADGIEIVAPGEQDYYTARSAEFAVTPAIFVMEGPSRFKQEGSHGLLSSIQVLIYVAESDVTGELLGKRLQRQVAAVIDSLYNQEPREKTDNGWNLQPLRTIPGSVFKPDHQHDWRGFYVIVFKVEQLEI